MKHFTALLLTLAFLAGCAAPTIAPYEGEDLGLVVFAADITASGDAELEYNYILTVENLDSGETHRQRMPVYEDRPYAVLGRLPPGDYRFVKREDIRRDARGIRLEEIDGEFSVAAGAITLPKNIRVEKGLILRTVEITDLAAEDAELTYDLHLLSNDDYAGWSLHQPE